MGRLTARAKALRLMAWLKVPEIWISEWVGTASNQWGVELEQFDRRNGVYRHRSFDDGLNPTQWVSGPHPIAQKLRDEGKNETDGFRKGNRV